MSKFILPVSPGVLSLNTSPTPEQIHRLRQGDYHKVDIYYGDYPNLHFLAEGAAHIREVNVHADMGHSLQVLSDLTRLEGLGLRGVSYAPGFDPGRLPALRYMAVDWHPDYPPLHCPRLEALYLYGPHAPDLRTVHAPTLRCLSVNGIPLQSTQGIENFSRLEQLWLMQQYRLEDFRGVEQLHQLKKFRADFCDIANWRPNPLRELTQLCHIEILNRQPGVLFPELHWLESFQALEYFAARSCSTHLSWPRLFSLPKLHALAISVNAEAQPWWESELHAIARACGREVESLSCGERRGVLQCSVYFRKPEVTAGTP